MSRQNPIWRDLRHACPLGGIHNGPVTLRRDAVGPRPLVDIFNAFTDGVGKVLSPGPKGNHFADGVHA